jgi:hypothetical protein
MRDCLLEAAVRRNITRGSGCAGMRCGAPTRAAEVTPYEPAGQPAQVCHIVVLVNVGGWAVLVCFVASQAVLA